MNAHDLALIAVDAADIIEQYADYIRTVKADELERHPYLPLVEDTLEKLRTEIAEYRRLEEEERRIAAEDFRADCARDDQMLRQWEDRS